MLSVINFGMSVNVVFVQLMFGQLCFLDFMHASSDITGAHSLTGYSLIFRNLLKSFYSVFCNITCSSKNRDVVLLPNPNMIFNLNNKREIYKNFHDFPIITKRGMNNKHYTISSTTSLSGENKGIFSFQCTLFYFSSSVFQFPL